MAWRKATNRTRSEAREPLGFISPMTWGVESHVIEPFASAGISREDICFSRDTYTFEFSDTPAKLLETFGEFYGPTMNAFDAAAKAGRIHALQRELGGLKSMRPARGPASLIWPSTLALDLAYTRSL